VNCYYCRCPINDDSDPAQTGFCSAECEILWLEKQQGAKLTKFQKQLVHRWHKETK